MQAVDGQDGAVLKEPAVEAKQFAIQDDGIVCAFLHFLKQGADFLHESLAGGRQGFEQFREAVFGQKLDILGKHAEQAAGEKLGNHVGLVPGLFQGFGELRQMAGNFAGDIGGAFRRIKGGGICPDEAETFADFIVGQVGQPDAKCARVGKWPIRFPGLRGSRNRA